MEEYTQFFNILSDNQKASSEEKKLELRLGPPGEFHSFNNGSKRVLAEQTNYESGNTEEKCWLSYGHEKQCRKFSSSVPWSSVNFQRESHKEVEEQLKNFCCSSSSCCCNSYLQLQCQDKKKGCHGHGSGSGSASFPAASGIAATRDGTSGPNKRVAPAPVVGWPPVRSFRKNLASNSNAKQASDLPNKTPTEVKPEQSLKNDLFVKINMEGIPIGRKINLNAYESYGKLSIAIDELFRGLLAGQSWDNCAVNKNDEGKGIARSSSGVGMGEYTLIYEDSEGDRILVGDVPWQMFVSTAKRLRVLKSVDQNPTSRREQDKL